MVQIEYMRLVSRNIDCVIELGLEHNLIVGQKKTNFQVPNGTYSCPSQVKSLGSMQTLK